MALEDELSCAVCTELFRDPVVLVCGHSFCGQCIGGHWSSSGSRNCPVCRQVSPQPPLPNLSLRNACETFIREQNNRTETEREEEHECPIHGEKIKHFCQTDEEVLCAECVKHGHRWHTMQPLQQAVRQRKGKLKAALRPAEKMLMSLQNGQTQEAVISKYNKTQVQQMERRIREEFKKLNQFLKKEEESRITALNEEEKEKRGQMEKRTKKRIQSLTKGLRDMEDAMKSDDITFLQNFDSTMNRIPCIVPDQELTSEAIIDVPKYLGNLKYQVWEKMKDICPYYPVILNPSSASPHISVSNDLTCVSWSLSRSDLPCPLPLSVPHGRMVLGSMGYGSGHQSWDVQVGTSRHWSLGVCLGSEERSIIKILNPAEPCFWGIRRDGDVYSFLNTPTIFTMKTHPQIVRMKLEDCYDKKGGWWRKMSYFDGECNCLFGFCHLSTGMDLFPFVMAEKRSGSLRVVPQKVTLKIEPPQLDLELQRSVLERHKVVLFGITAFLFLLLCVFIQHHSTDTQY